MRVHIPPGAGMGAHRYGGSDVILTPTVGMVVIHDGRQAIEVHTGDSARVRKGAYNTLDDQLIIAGAALS